MNITNNDLQTELTNRIIEMIEGETVENLTEILNVLTYHCGYRAGVMTGINTFEETLTNKFG